MKKLEDMNSEEKSALFSMRVVADYCKARRTCKICIFTYTGYASECLLEGLPEEWQEEYDNAAIVITGEAKHGT